MDILESTNSIREFIETQSKLCHDLYCSMHRQEHPKYGNGILSLKNSETVGKALLDKLPELESWLKEYETNQSRIWLHQTLEKGTQIIQRYKSWNNYWDAAVPTDSLASWETVEKLYTSSLDIQFQKALQQSYEVALKIRRIPERHEGECMVGLICILCDGDEWEWSKKCLAEADMPNNIFWTPTLQSQFLNEMKDISFVPEGWKFTLEKETFKRTILNSGTPFQFVQNFVSHVSHRWNIQLYRGNSEYELYKELLRKLPGLKESIQEGLSELQTLQEMY